MQRADLELAKPARPGRCSKMRCAATSRVSPGLRRTRAVRRLARMTRAARRTSLMRLSASRPSRQRPAVSGCPTPQTPPPTCSAARRQDRASRLGAVARAPKRRRRDRLRALAGPERVGTCSAGHVRSPRSRPERARFSPRRSVLVAEMTAKSGQRVGSRMGCPSTLGNLRRQRGLRAQRRDNARAACARPHRVCTSRNSGVPEASRTSLPSTARGTKRLTGRAVG